MANDLFVLPEYERNPFVNRLPPPHDHHASLESLTDLPTYNAAERSYPAYLRLHCLQRLTRYFDPNGRHLDLDQRLDLMLRQGYVGGKPLTTNYIDHLTNAHARVVARDMHVRVKPAESTAMGMALIDVSGMGKTHSVHRMLGRYMPQAFVHEHPVALHQVVRLRLDCPAKGSDKQLCFKFVKQMDRLLGTNFEARHGGAREPVDKMLPQMAAIANRHALGLLVIDEIQHLIAAPGPVRVGLLNFFVTLVNEVGVPLLLIGTPSAFPPLRSLLTYWRLDAREHGARVDEIVKMLRSAPGVADAYAELEGDDPAVKSANDVYAGQQGYLDPAPEEIDARWAWTQPNGCGAGIGVVDVERGWRFGHEDYAAKSPALLYGDNCPGSADHGTAVLGEMIAHDNTVGVVGIANAAGPVRASSYWDQATNTSSDFTNAFLAAIDALSPGDCMILEIQIGGAPVEWDDDAFDAARLPLP